MSNLYRLSDEELNSDKWALAREMCERYGYDLAEIADRIARFRMMRAEARAEAMREQAAKQPPSRPSAPATLTHFNLVRQFWDVKTQQWTHPNIVYIGRAMTGYLNLPASPYGNPFRLEKDTDDARMDALELYLNWIHLPAQAHLLEQLDSLRGKILVCFCHPRRCHGDVLIQLLQERTTYAASELQGEATDAEVEAGAETSQASAVRGPAGMDSASESRELATEPQRQPHLQTPSF